MRWLVEVSPVGAGASETEKLVVDAAQWQPALRAARDLRGEPAVLSGFSIELLADGYRAVDPTTNLRYEVRRADDDAPLTLASEVKRAAPKEEATETTAEPTSQVTTPKVEAVAATTPVVSDAAEADAKAEASEAEAASAEQVAPASKAEAPAEKADDAPKSETKPEPKADFDAKSETKPSAKVEPKSEAKPEPKTEAKVETKTEAKPEPKAGAKPEPKPDAKPAPEAAMKASAVRELLFERAEEATADAPLTYRECVWLVDVGLGSTELSAILAEKLDEVRAKLADAKPGKLVNLALYDERFEGKPKTRPIATLRWKDWSGKPAEIAFPRANEPTIPPPPRERTSTVPPPRKVAVPADDLLGDLFEAMHDLHFVGDVLEGAAWVLGLATSKLEAGAGYVHFYDINRREFVIVRAVGPHASDALLLRTPEKETLLAQAMRKRQAIVVGDATSEQRPTGPRWEKFGDDLRSIICAPVMLAGRFLGAIELVNPLDGGAFVDGDGHALSYIAEQLGEYLAARGITVDPERVKPSEAPAAPAGKVAKSPPRPSKSR